jgi:hypothetical protein
MGRFSARQHTGPGREMRKSAVRGIIANRRKQHPDSSQIADLAIYVRSSWGNRTAPDATPRMVASWRGIAGVPEYGTQTTLSIKCPEAGGAPGAVGPNPRGVSSVTATIQTHDLRIADLSEAYRKAVPDADPQQVIQALQQRALVGVSPDF